MTALTRVADKIDRAVQKVTPLAYRLQRQSRGKRENHRETMERIS